MLLKSKLEDTHSSLDSILFNYILNLFKKAFQIQIENGNVRDGQEYMVRCNIILKYFKDKDEKISHHLENLTFSFK